MTDTLLDVVDLTKTFRTGVRAADRVSLRIPRGGTLGIVGESGCGKSTTAKMILRLLEPDSGQVRFDGADVHAVRGSRLRELRKRMQLVPQNPQTSFNPRLTVRSSIEFSLRAHGFSRPQWRSRVDDLLERCGLPASYAERFPHQMSGGQLQRAAIARALATEPDLVVCDEAVSALDKSVQAQVLNLLVDLQRELGVSYLFISHDLSVVEHVSDRVAVMYLGRVVEEAPAGRLYADPRHPYTQMLLDSAPGAGRRPAAAVGEPPDPTSPPPGCGFSTRCPHVMDVCRRDRPPLLSAGTQHLAACFLNDPGLHSVARRIDADPAPVAP